MRPKKDYRDTKIINSLVGLLLVFVVVQILLGLIGRVQ